MGFKESDLWETEIATIGPNQEIRTRIYTMPDGSKLRCPQVWVRRIRPAVEPEPEKEKPRRKNRDYYGGNI